MIGNPPYIGFQELVNKNYYNRNYFTAKKKYDIYVLFIELIQKIASSLSISSYILPHKYLVADFGKPTRILIKKLGLLNQIIHFGRHMVFEDATTYTCISFFSFGNLKFNYTSSFPKLINGLSYEDFKNINYNELNNSGWIIADKSTREIISKVQNSDQKISHYFEGIFQGIVSGDNDSFYLYDCNIKDNKYINGLSKSLRQNVILEKEICKKLLNGKNLEKWIPNFDETYIIYPYHNLKGKTVLYTEFELKKYFPLAFEYFTKIKNSLLNRGTDKMKYPNWYALWNARNIIRLSSEKIITPDVCFGTKMSLDADGSFFHNDTSYVMILKKEYQQEYKKFLGMLNSKLIWFFLKNTGNVIRGGYFRFKTKYLEPISIPFVDREKQMFIESIVDQILEKKKQNPKADTSRLEAEIDNMVYKLYGLTYEEVKIVDPEFGMSENEYNNFEP